RDVSNQVGAAGRTAHEQLDRLVSGFERLNEFGKASERQVTALDERVRETLELFQAQLDLIESTAGGRLDAVKMQAEEYRSEVESTEETAREALEERMGALKAAAAEIGGRLREAESEAMDQLMQSKERFKGEIAETIETLDNLDAKAIAAAQERVARLNAGATQFNDQLLARGRQFDEQVSRVQEEFATHEAQASEMLAQRLADLDDALAERRAAQIAEAEKLVEQGQSMSEQLEQLSDLIARIDSQGEATRSGLSAGLDALDRELEAKREQLRATETQLAGLTEAGVRLLEIIQASARFSKEDLQAALDNALGNLVAVEERAQGVSGLMLASNEKADALSGYLIEAQSRIAETDGSIEALHAKIAEQSEEALARIQGLRTGFALLAEESSGFAGETQEQVRAALEALEQSTQSVFETLETGTRDKVDALAQSISTKAVAELERTLRNDTAEAAGKLEQAAAHASGMGREATVQLRDQLAKVNELTLNLERRIARARELAEEQVGNDFSRRMALITDSLNSNAIDLAGALSSEVTDTSWDAYLKGDRGIFTRRAVRLIDSGEARDIAELYQRDETFKANVNRYIHDFEAMLRAMLSTRDGKALSVTMLGSDVGKLYVVLAQAIERFRQ
ncbi:MAG: ATPase, partial [Erythrobacter sp.]|nr:ATPase [Erythrobacter sp.]